MSNTTDFETSKALAEYVQIKTEKVIVKDDFTYTQNEIKRNYLWIHQREHYPAPTLEELLKASPIFFGLMFHLDGKVSVNTYFNDGKYQEYSYNKSDNLVEQVALIILEYYNKDEKERRANEYQAEHGTWRR